MNDEWRALKCILIRNEKGDVRLKKKYLQAVLIWILIVPIGILNGGLREMVLNILGKIALPLSGIILSTCIFLVAHLLIPRIKDCKKSDYYNFGIIWFLLTNLFDLAMYLSMGGGFRDLLRAYNFLTGNLWIIVVLSTLFSPVITAKRKKLI